MPKTPIFTALAVPILSRDFYARPTVTVARELLGKLLVHASVRGQPEPASGIIVETEAYLGQNDEASHSFRGLTPRTQVIFGPPGYAYVYFTYGMHYCLNVVAESDGVAGCVLIRAIQPLSGLPVMSERRGNPKREIDLANGPAKLAQALGIDLRHYGHDLTQGDLTIREAPPAAPEAGRRSAANKVVVSKRIGISKSVDLPLRFRLVPG